MTEIFDRHTAPPLRRLATSPSYFLAGIAGQVDPDPLTKPPAGSPGTRAEAGWAALDGAAEACVPEEASIRQVRAAGRSSELSSSVPVMMAAIAAMAMTRPCQEASFLAGLFLAGLFLALLFLAKSRVSGQPNSGSRSRGSGSAPDTGSPLLRALNIANFAASLASFARPFDIPAS
jgi:hypothetical protein